MRDYDPTTGRYLQADPLGLVDGASVYGYVGQSPLVFTDPNGLKKLFLTNGGWIIDKDWSHVLGYPRMSEIGSSRTARTQNLFFTVRHRSTRSLIGTTIQMVMERPSIEMLVGGATSLALTTSILIRSTYWRWMIARVRILSWAHLKLRCSV